VEVKALGWEGLDRAYQEIERAIQMYGEMLRSRR